MTYRVKGKLTVTFGDFVDASGNHIAEEVS
jgi:hypothetical protein